MARVRVPLLILVCGAASAPSVLTDRADACTIIVPTVVLPSMTPAPRNAHVWVLGLPLPLYAGASFVLVPTADPSHPVPLALRSWETSMAWELVPRDRLAPVSRYELWGIPRQKGKKPLIIGLFQTTSDDDATPPSPPTLSQARYVLSMVACPPTIQIEGKPGADASGDVLHAIWLSGPGGSISYRTAPTDIAHWPHPSALEPHPSLFLTRTLDGPGAFRIGIRAVDVAGNLSDPVEISVTR